MTAVVTALGIALLVSAPFIVMRAGFIVGSVIILISMAILGAMLPGP